NGKAVFGCYLATRNREVHKLMDERRQHRQASRRGERLARKRLGRRYGTTFECMMERRLPGTDKPVCVEDIINTESRFNNRRRPTGWITPTVRQLIQTHMSLIRKVSKLLPVADISIQVDKFAFMILDNGMIWGSDFCNGRMKGYKSVKDYVSARQCGKCILCGKPIEHFHHVVPRHLGGSDLPENIAGLCKDCHEGIHTDRIQSQLKGRLKGYAGLSALNQAMPFILKEMVSAFGEDNVHPVNCNDVSECMTGSGIPRSLAAASAGCDITVTDTDCDHYELQQFRRHDKQFVKSQRERTYKLDGVTVAKNRTPRFEQPKDMPALSDWYKDECFTKGKATADTELSRLKVTKSR
ncbi:MAG: RRXRR domain-containing protein, partial [Candidatus Weimeria sp.]